MKYNIQFISKDRNVFEVKGVNAKNLDEAKIKVKNIIKQKGWCSYEYKFMKAEELK